MESELFRQGGFKLRGMFKPLDFEYTTEDLSKEVISDMSLILRTKKKTASMKFEYYSHVRGF
jgi:hypothetical protein